VIKKGVEVVRIDLK